jgi:hypothetical protein
MQQRAQVMATIARERIIGIVRTKSAADAIATARAMIAAASR